MIRPSQTLIDDDLVGNEIEKQVYRLIQEVENQEKCAESHMVKSVKTEPIEITGTENFERNHLKATSSVHPQDVIVKTEIGLNEERNNKGSGAGHKNAGKDIHNLISNLDSVNDVDYIRDIKREVLYECEQATCDNLIETIEQNFEEIDKIICGNLNNKNGFNKESERESIEMVEVEQNVKEKAATSEKFDLSEVLNAVDNYESAKERDVSDLNDRTADYETYISGSDTDPYGQDSDNGPDKNNDDNGNTGFDKDQEGFNNEPNKNNDGNNTGIDSDQERFDNKPDKNDDSYEIDIDNDQEGFDEVDGGAPIDRDLLGSVTSDKNLLGNVTADKDLLKKFSISECCVQLKDIDDNYTDSSEPLVVIKTIKEDEIEFSETVIRKDIPEGMFNNVQCKVCLMKLKDVKSLLIHSRIHMKYNLICCICRPSHTYKTLSEFETHMAKHGNSSLECTLCGQICKNERKLKLHGKKHGIRPYLCSLCPKSYLSPRDLEDHLRSHTNTRPFECSICKVCFTATKYLARHKRDCHENRERKFTCNVCFKSFKRKAHLLSHKVHMHSDLRPHVCETCGRSYKSGGSLSLHKRSHTGERVTCERCGRNFRDPGDLRKHIRVVHDKIKNFKCDICGHVFANQSNLNVHMNHHIEPSLKERKFKCEKCEWRAINMSQLRIHMKTHIETLDFKCPHCVKQFKCKTYLEKHVRHIHDRTGEKFQCQECSKSFTAKQGLNKHMKYHKFGRRFKCETCSAMFVYRSCLKEHIQHTHEGIKRERKTCKVCDKKVVNLTSHMQSHITEKLFKCERCGKKFRTEEKLTLHHRVHWDIKPYFCKGCDVGFSRGEYYRLHMIKFHDIKLTAEEAELRGKVEMVGLSDSDS